MPLWLAILAQEELDSWGRVIGGAIVAIIVFGSWLTNILTAMRKKREEMRRGRSQPPLHPAAQQPKPANHLEQLAQQRRAQLQQLAQQRRGQAGAAPLQSDIDAQQRRAQLQQLAQQRRGQAGAAPLQSDIDAQQRQARAAAEQHRQQLLAQRRAQLEAQQRAQQEQRRRLQQAASQRQSHSAAPQRSIEQKHPPQLKVSKLGAGALEIAPDHAVIEVDESVVHRHVSDAPSVAPKADKPAALQRRRLSRRSLQRAIVLKEILDSPVSLRDPQSDGL